jgi:hypothetical protein
VQSYNQVPLAQVQVSGNRNAVARPRHRRHVAQQQRVNILDKLGRTLSVYMLVILAVSILLWQVWRLGAWEVNTDLDTKWFLTWVLTCSMPVIIGFTIRNWWLFGLSLLNMALSSTCAMLLHTPLLCAVMYLTFLLLGLYLGLKLKIRYAGV